MIDLYYAPTPNGHKITLFLEEAELAYRLLKVDISKAISFALIFWLSPTINSCHRRSRPGRRRSTA